MINLFLDQKINRINILFIYSEHNNTNRSKPLFEQWNIPFGISHIIAYLKKYGYDPQLIVLNKKNEMHLDQYMARFSPRIIAFSAVATEYSFIAAIAQKIKRERPEIFLIAGGPHISLDPESCIADAFDAICIGEGEMPLLELVQQLAQGLRPGGIPNLWIKQGSNIEKNPTRPFLADLDGLPFPERQIWQEWIEHPASKPSILVGRGCPFKCTYCSNHALSKLAPGPYVRLRSVDHIIQEIAAIAGKYPLIKEIFLEVETFGTDISWAKELCRKLGEFNQTLKEPISYGTNLRITPVVPSDDFFQELVKGNIKSLQIGLESGSEKIRRQVLGRFESNADIVKAAKLAHKHGIALYFYNMIGVPGETMADFQETVRIIRDCSPKGLFPFIFYPYPGTELHKVCLEMGLLDKPITPDYERERATLEVPGFPRNQIQRAYIWYYYYIYKGIKPTYRLLLIVMERHLNFSFPSCRPLVKGIFDVFRRVANIMDNLIERMANLNNKLVGKG